MRRIARRIGTLTTCVVLAAAVPVDAQVVARAAEVPALTEGPAVDAEGNVYFTELRAERIYRLGADGALTVFRERSRAANGLVIDPQGGLVAAEGGGEGAPPRITRTNLTTGAVEVLADAFEGQPFTRPNDVTLDGRGRVYFTDPAAGSVYRIDAPGQVARVLGPPDILRPNGLQIAPGDDVLYVVESGAAPDGARMVRAFDLAGDGTATNGRVHFDFAGRSGDGASIDWDGNLYVAAGLNALAPPGALDAARAWGPEALRTRGAVYVISPGGALLNVIPVAEDVITNTAFGGPDMRTLYVTAGRTLFSVRTEVPGLSR